MTKLGIHHHFCFSQGTLKNTGYVHHITFANIPFFQLYSYKDLRYIRQAVDALMTEMPHKLQKAYQIFKPPPYKEFNHYRSELICLEYCTYNKVGFFIRVYHLRSENFCKVEITFSEETLGKGKYLNLEKCIIQAQNIFRFIEQKSISLSLSKHKDEYFFPDDLLQLVRVYEKRLESLRSCNTKKIKNFLKEKFCGELKEFQNQSKKIAYTRLKLIREEISLMKTLE